MILIKLKLNYQNTQIDRYFFELSSSVEISICVGVFIEYSLFSVADLCFDSITQRFKKDGRSTKEIWSFTLLPPSYYGLVILK